VTGTTIETFSLVIVTAIILALVQEGVRKLLNKPKEKPAPTSSNSYVTRGELDDYCKLKQDSCANKQIVEILKTSFSELRTEVKSEMSELRKLVMSLKE
jgi:inhibitor of KinA sporulation pathway (predicted exonuclease)